MASPVQLGKAFAGNIKNHHVPNLAAELAYHMLLSLAPALIFIFTMVGLVIDSNWLVDQVIYYAGQVVPGDALGLVEDLMTNILNDASGGLALIAILGALWTASNGANVVLRALNHAYGFDDPNIGFFRQKLLSVLVVLSLGLGIFLASSLIIVGSVALNLATEFVHLQTDMRATINVVRWVIALLLVTVFSAYVYTKVPDALNRISIREALPGAIVFVLLWAGASFLFNLYVENMAKYSEVYGPLGAIVVLLIWLYISALALLIGAEVNGMRARFHRA